MSLAWPLVGAPCSIVFFVMGDLEYLLVYYMEFLGLDKSAWPTERNTSDIHEYLFAEDGNSYMMEPHDSTLTFSPLVQDRRGHSAEQD